jgi:hypothetical protein
MESSSFQVIEQQTVEFRVPGTATDYRQSDILTPDSSVELQSMAGESSEEASLAISDSTTEQPIQTASITENLDTNLSLPYLATLKNFDPSEIELIRSRRQALILKELKEALTRAEEKEIQYLDWQLDRYEIARDREDFDEEDKLIARNQHVVESLLKTLGINAK